MQTNRKQKRKKKHSLKRPSSDFSQVQDSLLSIDNVNKLANAFFNNTTEGILITDKNQTILKINHGFSTISGYSEESVIGKKPSILKSNRHDASFYKQIFETINKNGKWKGEIWNRRKNGEIYLQLLSIVPIYDETDEIGLYFGLFTDLSQYINNTEQIQNHTYYDMLTNLPNRILLHDRLSFMINHAKRNNQNMAILLMDLNRFKLINDTLGFSAGDSLLQTIANRLKSCLRDVDGVFRLGDDEFAILLEEISQPQDAARVAKRLLSVSSQPFQFYDHELYVTVSLGISIYPTDGEEVEVLLKNAEAAMNRAKELGINNYQHYMPTMNARAFEQLTLEHNLRKALQKDQFLVYYQPQVDMRTQKIIGAEALVRWQHPELGMISPAQFIPIAEETGLILSLGEWVLRTACQQAKKWYDQLGATFSISVNLSSKQFQQQNFVSTVNRVLKDIKLPPELLELEITESMGMKNPELTLKILNELKSMGINIAIDDFGTGYSSLSYLKRFPIDTLKIDRSFVSDIMTDSNDAAIVVAVIALAHSLKLKVIAEGVETAQQADYLLKHRCEQIQGFLFSPPVPAHDFEKIIRKNLLPNQ